MYQGLKGIKRGFVQDTTYCKAKDGELIGEPAEVLNRWAEYFSELLNEDVLDESYTLREDNVEVEEPTLAEVGDAIAKLNNHKVAGEDLLPGELFKYGGDRLTEEMHKLVTEIWKREIMPEEWNTAVIVPLYKKGDKLSCSNYRGISLLNTGYNIFSRILANRLKPRVEEVLGEYQCGFRPNRSTTDQMFTLRIIMEKCYEFNVTLHQLFIDFRAAYDQILREQLFRLMQNEFHFPAKLIKLTKMTLRATNSKVKIKSELSNCFAVKRGLRQGDSLSTLLFNLALEAVVRKCPINPGGCIFNRTCQKLAFADDIAVVATRQDILKENVDTIRVEAAQIGLEISGPKTKYMINSRNTTRWRNVQDFHGFERVKQFTYLGGQITENNEVTAEIQARIAKGNRCYYNFINVLKSSLISRQLKIKVYDSNLSSETWTLTVKNQNSLQSWERKVLRKMRSL